MTKKMVECLTVHFASYVCEIDYVKSPYGLFTEAIEDQVEKALRELGYQRIFEIMEDRKSEIIERKIRENLDRAADRDAKIQVHATHSLGTFYRPPIPPGEMEIKKVSFEKLYPSVHEYLHFCECEKYQHLDIDPIVIRQIVMRLPHNAHIRDISIFNQSIVDFSAALWDKSLHAEATLHDYFGSPAGMESRLIWKIVPTIKDINDPVTIGLIGNEERTIVVHIPDTITTTDYYVHISV